MEMKDMNLLGIIGIIGAILLIVGVFLAWVSGGSDSSSGWEYFKDATAPFGCTWVPLLALICGIISLVLMIVPVFMNTEKFSQINNILGIIALILSIVVVIGCILWYTQTLTEGGISMSFQDFLKLLGLKVGIGFWLVLVGGIITMIGGLMPIIKNKFL